jgi:hypothetical protein
MNKIPIHPIKLLQDITPWFLRQTNRLQMIWTKNKPIMDDLEKWDRYIEESVEEVKYNSQVLSFEAYISKKIGDFYLLYPIQSTYSGVTGVLTNTGFTGFQISGSTSSRVDIKLSDVLGRGFVETTSIRLRCYVQPLTNDKIPYVQLYDSGSGVVVLNDWFVPNMGELTAMYDNLKMYSLGGFNTFGAFYGTSNETSATSYQIKRFSDGVNGTTGKSGTRYIRLARKFTSSEYSVRDIGPSGGYIFYVSGTTCYEAAPTDVLGGMPAAPIEIAYSNITGATNGSTNTGIGAGQQCTTAIISQVGHTGSAAKVATDFEIVIGAAGGFVSDPVGLSGGWNDIKLVLSDTSSVDTTYLSFVLESGQSYLVKDMGIYYEKSADAVVGVSPKSFGDFYIYDDDYITNQPDTYEYPFFMSDTQDGWYNVSFSASTNMTITTGFTDKVVSVNGTCGVGGGNIIFSTDNDITGSYDSFLVYSNLSIVGNTGVECQLGYFDGSTWVIIDRSMLRTYYSSEVLEFSNSGITGTGTLKIKLIFDSNVDFVIDFMVGNKTGIFYNELVNEEDSGGAIVIYIDDKDFGDAQLKYINYAVNIKKPVGIQYSIDSF